MSDVETVLVRDEPTMKQKRALTVVTSSELQTFRDCPHKHGLSYVEGLRPKVAPRALSFGTATHAGLAAAIAEQHPQDAVVSGIAAAEEKLGKWLATLLDAGLSADRLDELAAEGEAAVKLSSWMVEHYVETFVEDWKYLVPLGIEQAFQLRAQNAKGIRVGHLAYAGVWDLVAYDRRFGDIVVMDHKTTSGNVSDIDRRVELDPQIAGYVWAVRRALWDADAQLGETALALPMDDLLDVDLRDTRWQARTFIDGTGKMRGLTSAEAQRILDRKVATGRVIYNVLRKKRPSEPHVNKDGSVSAAKIDTLAPVYERALVEQSARGKPITLEQGALLETLRLKGDSFISRREFHRSDEEIERWRRELFVDAQRVRMAEADPDQRTRNPGHCCQPWSMPCAYRRPCLDPTMRDGFDVMTTRHVEIEEAKEEA